MKYWRLHMSVASQANASLSLPSCRVLRSVFKRLRNDLQNINTEKSMNIYLGWNCCLKPRSQLLPMVLGSRPEEWYSRRVYLHLHELLISLLELGTKGMLVCMLYWRIGSGFSAQSGGCGPHFCWHIAGKSNVVSFIRASIAERYSIYP